MRLGIDFGTTRIVVAAADRANCPVAAFETGDTGVRDWSPPLAAVAWGKHFDGEDARPARTHPDAFVVPTLDRYPAAAGPETPVEIDGPRAPLREVAFHGAGFNVLGLLHETPSASVEYGHRHRQTASRKQTALVYGVRGGDPDPVQSSWPHVEVPVADFHARCSPLVTETRRAVGSPTAGVTGGSSELGLVSPSLRDRCLSQGRRSPYTHPGSAAVYLRHDQFTRYFGVGRETNSGLRLRMDRLFPQGTPLPASAAETVPVPGHFPDLECGRLSADGEPEGEITLWDEIHFPFDPALFEAAGLDRIPVSHSRWTHRIAEEYRCGAGGGRQPTITNLDARYERTYRLGRWGACLPPIVPGGNRSVSSRRKKFATSQ